MAQAGYDPREAVAFWERMSGCPEADDRQTLFSFAAGDPRISVDPSVRCDAYQSDRSLDAGGDEALPPVGRDAGIPNRSHPAIPAADRADA